MKTVAVVGAGPAGLVAAKTLLHHGGGTHFKVTIFEAADRVGGMWRAHVGEQGDKCSPSMRTNLSRYTVAFPDLSWTSVNLTQSPASSGPSPKPPMFPQAWQVGRYLETYARTFLPSNLIRLHERVVRVERESDWHITTLDTKTQRESQHHFDYLLIASGFFDKPATALYKHVKVSSQAVSRVQHSSRFRQVASFSDMPGKIAVIGGGISGVEAAATAASQISDASVNTSTSRPGWSRSAVYHIASRPFHVLPRYLPQDPRDEETGLANLAPHFLPLDLVLYNLSRRGKASISASNGLVPPDKARKGHAFIKSVVGDNDVLGNAGVRHSEESTQYPAFTGIAESYTEFVRSGTIIPIMGRVQSIVDSGTDAANHSSRSLSLIGDSILNNNDSRLQGSCRLKLSEQGSTDDAACGQHTFQLDDIQGVVDATGYQVNLDFLSSEVKQALDYDPDSGRVPLLLGRCSIFGPKLRDAAFVGFYEGPYWTVMDMQARLIAQVWAPLESDDALSQSVDVYRSDNSESNAVRDALRRHDLAVPHFWMSDYVGVVEELARAVGVQRNDATFAGQTGPAFPARYGGSDAEVEAQTVIEDVADILRQSQDASLFVAAAVFSAMQGKWTLHRKITSRHASMPNGVFIGTADFHPRTPTDVQYSSEYLYVEEGTLQMANGLAFPATRRYVYRYNADLDTITAWFAGEDGHTTNNIFNTWEFRKPNSAQLGWLAQGHHWCSPDTYDSQCEFRFNGANLKTFNITYSVTGPKKDYTHDSWYSRPIPDSG